MATKTRAKRAGSRQPAAGGNGRPARLALQDVPLAKIDPGPFNPRRDFPAEEIEQLAATIRTAGVLQPIIVRKKDKRFELVAGERRLRAARVAGLDKIPCHVLRLDDRQAREVAVLEDGVRSEGAHEVGWDGANRQGLPASAGMYFVRLDAGGETRTSKITLVK